MPEEQTTVDQATEQQNLDNEQTTEKVFTQDDVNRIGTKEHNSGYSKAIRDLGFEDAETAKQALKDYQEWQESQKTEVQKQSEELSAKEKALENAQQANKVLEAKLAAVSSGVNPDSVDDVIALAERIVTDDVTMAQAITQVLEKYPQFSSQDVKDEEETRPNFFVGGNPGVSKTSVIDPF